MLKVGQYIPRFKSEDKSNLLLEASLVEPTSSLSLSEIPFDGPYKTLEFGFAQLLPLSKGLAPVFELVGVLVPLAILGFFEVYYKGMSGATSKRFDANDINSEIEQRESDQNKFALKVLGIALILTGMLNRAE